jgi:hypothetical protein
MLQKLSLDENELMFRPANSAPTLHPFGRRGAASACERQPFIYGLLKSTAMPPASLDPSATVDGPITRGCYAALAAGRPRRANCQYAP